MDKTEITATRKKCINEIRRRATCDNTGVSNLGYQTCESIGAGLPRIRLPPPPPPRPLPPGMLPGTFPTFRVSSQEKGTSKTRYRATEVRIHKPTQLYEEQFRVARVEGG